MISPLLALLSAWLLGALPMGRWIARWRGGPDPTRIGSGSSGATNTGRLLGWRWGVLVGLLDLGKGALAAALGVWVGADQPWLAAATGLAAVAGHCWSPLARWRGGKGAATGAGAALVLAPVAATLSLAGAVVLLLLTRRMAPASLAGVTLFPALLYVTGEAQGPGLGFGLALLVLVWFTHRSNLGRLAGGGEPTLW